MNIVAIYGTEHIGSTYNISKLFLKELNAKEENIKEFFLPRDMPYFCKGCTMCFTKNEKLCPHYKEISIIKEAMEKADLLIFASPVYVLGMTAQIKALFDHFAFQFMLHKPNKTMFQKIALVISTSAGSGHRSTNKGMKDNLKFWGVGRIFEYGKAVGATNWESVSFKKKQKINNEIEKLSNKVIKTYKNFTTSFNTKILFYKMRFVQTKFIKNENELNYWKLNGWLDSKRPWHKS